ncbi:MAG: acyl-CoA dehydrogenase family protein [Planctomycetota bacterium]
MSLAPRITSFNQDEQILLEIVRDFARDRLFSLDRKCDKDESSVNEVLPELANLGLLSLAIPEEFGGLTCSYRLFASMLYEIAYWSPSTSVTISVHNMVAKALRNSLKGPLCAKILPTLATPDGFSALAISEAGSGSDARATTTTATRVDGGYHVTGEKMWITNGLAARWLLTLVRMDDSPPREGHCLLLIDAHSPGVGQSKIHGKMGIRGSETAVISFHEVFVPGEQLIGEEGDGLKVALSTLSEGRISIATQAAGMAEACVDEMTRYANQREQFDQPIGKFQGVANMIADSAMELEAAKVLIWNAASEIDAGRKSRLACSMAKLYATECANRIAYRAVQVHGGAGYVNECRVEQLYRDVRVTTIYEGTSEIQRLVIAGELRKTAATV